MKHPKRILAIDIGGTKLKAAVIDPQGKLLSKRSQRADPPSLPAGDDGQDAGRADQATRIV